MAEQKIKPARALVVLLLAISGIFGAPVTARAANPSVVYDGAEKEWYGEGLSREDVILDVEDVMPGDVLGQQFDLALRRVERGVTVSLRIEADPATIAALSDATVIVRGADGGSLAQGTLGELAKGDSRALVVGEFADDVVIPLGTEVSIPTSLGNELQGTTHEIRLVFVAQEDGNTSSAGSDDLLVQTGDNPWSVYGPVVLGLLGLDAIIAALVVRRRNR